MYGHANKACCCCFCVGNRAQCKFRIKEVEWDRKRLKGLDLKNLKFKFENDCLTHVMSEYCVRCNHCYSQVVGNMCLVAMPSCSAL